MSRAYPLQILVWHEIVNDTAGGVPVTVTFCPLCYTAIAFDRRAAGRVLDFGTTGNLRNSDLVMYDRQTESWWQQAVGQAIVGDLTGTQLTILPAGIVSWDVFRTAHPAEGGAHAPLPPDGGGPRGHHRGGRGPGAAPCRGPGQEMTGRALADWLRGVEVAPRPA